MLINSTGNSRDQLKAIIDKPIDTTKFKVFDKMVSELGPHMNSFEVDKCVEFMYTLETSEFDINPSITDCKTQLRILIGRDRFDEIVEEWKKYNQKLVTAFGTMKFKDKKTSKVYDGLDEWDNPDDFEKIYT
jgi:hypothetical protein